MMCGKRKSHYLQVANFSVQAKFSRYEKSVDRLSLDPVYQLSITELIIDFENVLGRGHFGTVYKGIVSGRDGAFKLQNKNGNRKVALAEAQILAQVGFHSNVVNFLGTYGNEIGNGIPYIVTEFCSNGPLKTYLRNMRSVGSLKNKTRGYSSFFQLLNKFCLEISLGMQHIVSKNIVHRDLATRNILLDHHLVCKISDFGLSVKNKEGCEPEIMDEPVLLPWRWMAYESLSELKFSSMTDMWSYGVVVWEIFTLGQTPYDGLNWTPDFINELRKGLRLLAPNYATPSLNVGV